MASKKQTKEVSFTPMVEQYLSFKRDYQDTILFFRIGDFYEMFLEDAETVSKELGLFLTKKAAGNGQFIPMCGIPHHAYLEYCQRLVDKGYKVAICEQVEDPKMTKKLVKRDIIQIITPGTNLDVKDSDNHFIGSLAISYRQAFLAYADISTGEMHVLSLEATKEKILEQALTLDLKELVVPTNIDANIIIYLKKNSNVLISYFNDCSTSLETENLYVNLRDDRQIEASARLYNYLINTEKRELDYFKPVVNVMEKKTMKIDYSAQANMELVKSLDGKSFGTLYWLLNKTNTAMGSRYLKSQILAPSASINDINNHLDITEGFVNHFLEREVLRTI
jgi:DNA mismatch repair protein MutS